MLILGAYLAREKCDLIKKTVIELTTGAYSGGGGFTPKTPPWIRPWLTSPPKSSKLTLFYLQNWNLLKFIYSTITSIPAIILQIVNRFQFFTMNYSNKIAYYMTKLSVSWLQHILLMLWQFCIITAINIHEIM